MKVSDVKRVDMNSIDLSNNVRYSAIVNGKLIQYQTDGAFNKHLTMREWSDYIKKIKIINNN